MLKAITFALIAFAPDGNAYELDSGLDHVECMAALATVYDNELIWIIPGREAVANAGFEFACQTENAAR